MPSVQDLIDAEYARSEAENYAKFCAKRAGATVLDMRQAAVELRAAPQMSAVVDVNRTPLPPVAASTPNPVKPEAYCKHCGRVFKSKTVGMAKMQRNRHEKKDHADQSATR